MPPISGVPKNASLKTSAKCIQNTGPGTRDNSPGTRDNSSGNYKGNPPCIMSRAQGGISAPGNRYTYVCPYLTAPGNLQEENGPYNTRVSGGNFPPKKWAYIRIPVFDGPF